MISVLPADEEDESELSALTLEPLDMYTNTSPRSGSPATALRRRPVTRRNANKLGAMGK